MVVEVLGSRVIGPFFGVSLFVWTSLISVAMISLAIGYAMGGILSDRRSSADNLYGLISIAGVCVILIPFVRLPVLKFSMELGLRAGAFFSSLVLFGPSLILLGCVSPYLIKIVAREVTNIGRTVGSFYALSTVGSVVGTIMTGFFLIAYLSVTQIFFLVGGLLIMISIVYFAVFRGKRVAALAAIFLLFLPLFGEEQLVAKQMDNGTLVQLVDQTNSYYGDVKVVDYTYGDKHQRELIIDGLIQGGYDMVNGLPFYPYSYLLSYLPMKINPEGKKALVIGLGAGVIPRWFEAEGILTDVVDIDADVVEMARKHFGFQLQGDVYVQDARYFLGRNQEKYDFIILDVFNGDTTPAHVISLEAFQLMHQNLSGGGVLGLNLIAKLKGDTLVSASVVKTLEQVFDNVEVYPNFNPHKESSGNISILAYDGPAVPLDGSVFRSVRVHPTAAAGVYNFAQNRFHFDEDVEAILLTDNFNPMDCLDTDLKETVRQNIVNGTDWDVLLH
jgi:spermidine synthase